jgi:hypothetical protein
MLPDIEKAAFLAVSRPSGVEKDPLTNMNVGGRGARRSVGGAGAVGGRKKSV